MASNAAPSLSSEPNLSGFVLRLVLLAMLLSECREIACLWASALQHTSAHSLLLCCSVLLHSPGCGSYLNYVTFSVLKGRNITGYNDLFVVPGATVR